MPTVSSNTTPLKDFSQPPHKYIKDQPKRRVDSKSESKSESNTIPQYIGTSYTHNPNAPYRPSIPRPINPTLPVPYTIPTISAYSHMPLMNNRTPSGVILGSHRKRYVNEENVPYLVPDVPVGPGFLLLINIAFKFDYLYVSVPGSCMYIQLYLCM